MTTPSEEDFEDEHYEAFVLRYTQEAAQAAERLEQAARAAEAALNNFVKELNGFDDAYGTRGCNSSLCLDAQVSSGELSDAEKEADEAIIRMRNARRVAQLARFQVQRTLDCLTGEGAR